MRVFSATILVFLSCFPVLAAIAEFKYWNDSKMRSHFQKELEKLMDANQSASLSELKRQLTQEHRKFELKGLSRVHDSPEKLYHEVSKSVLAVGRLYNCGKCSKWHVSSASGFAIGENGVIVTNYHVLEKGGQQIPGVMNYEGKVFAIEKVLAANREDDLVVLKLENAKLVPLPLGKPAEVGSEVWVISHPDGQMYLMTGGLVSRYNLMPVGSQNGRRMAITADYAKGSSGAPVLNHKGEVVGVVASTTSIYYDEAGGRKQNLQMVVKNCIPVQALRELIDP